MHLTGNAIMSNRRAMQRPGRLGLITVAVFVAAWLMAGSAAHAQAGFNNPIGCGPAPADGNLIIGTWKLNLGRSKIAAPVPRSEVRFYFAWGNGQVDHVERVDADGKLLTSGYGGCFDGKDYVRHGASSDGEARGTVALKRIDKYTVEAITRYGKFVMNSKLWVAKDGKTFTSEQTGKDAAGNDVNNVLVFDRIG